MHITTEGFNQLIYKVSQERGGKSETKRYEEAIFRQISNYFL